MSGRRVRGWVVEAVDEGPGDLREVLGHSGEIPVFGSVQLGSLLWAARHYVAPVAVVLAKASPPNLPKRRREKPQPLNHIEPRHRPAGSFGTAVSGGRGPTTALVGAWRDLRWLAGLGDVLAPTRSAVVVVATAAEAAGVASAARESLGDQVVEVATQDDAGLTRAWERAQDPGRLLVGTPRIALWQIAGLAQAVVLEEGRRAMKDRQTPTIHVREVMRKRSLVEGFNLAFLGPTPSVELLAAGAQVVGLPGRPWALVEVVDRSSEPPGGGLIADQVAVALRSAGAAGAFVMTGRKMVQPLIDEINRRLGDGLASAIPTDARVTVGTEADLAGLESLDLGVVPDVDFLLSGTGYRASEEALRQVARLAGYVGRGRGRRVVVQTRHPDSKLIASLRRGSPIPYLEDVLVERARAGTPPSVEMVAIEVRGSVPKDLDAEIRSLTGVEVLGPATYDRGTRWLLSGDLGKAKAEMRPMIGRWREKGATVRVDADPIDF